MLAVQNIAQQIVANPGVGIKLQVKEPKTERDWIDMKSSDKPAELLLSNREVVMPILEFNGTCLKMFVRLDSRSGKSRKFQNRPVLLGFRQRIDPGTPLDRRGPPGTSICTKNQPRRPILRPFRGHFILDLWGGPEVQRSG